MNLFTKTISTIILITVFFELNSMAQIQDIKKNSKENELNHSNNNASNNNSSDNNTSNSENENNEITTGCISSIFNILTGCLFSAGNKENNENYNNNYNNNPDDFVVIIPDDTNNTNNNNYPNSKVNNNFDDSTQYYAPAHREFSVDLNANFALGFQYGSDTSYNYYNFLPQIRVNLAWFLIDFRYNMLAQISNDLPDSYKMWDLLALLKISPDDNTNFILGTGIHHEEFSKMNFNEHFLGAKFGLFDNRDFLDINGRFAIDYSTKTYPYTEVSISYNKRFIDAKNVNGYISIGGIYQNYYSSVDIWGLRAGIVINWHN